MLKEKIQMMLMMSMCLCILSISIRLTIMILRWTLTHHMEWLHIESDSSNRPMFLLDSKEYATSYIIALAQRLLPNTPHVC